MRTTGMVGPVTREFARGRADANLRPRFDRGQAIPYNRAHALVPARENLVDRAQIRARRVLARPRALSVAAPDRARAHALARYLVAARGAPPPRAPGPRPDLRQVRLDAL